MRVYAVSGPRSDVLDLGDGAQSMSWGVSIAHLWLSATIIFVPEAASKFRSVTRSNCAPQLIRMTIWACIDIQSEAYSLTRCERMVAHLTTLPRN